MPDPKYEVYLGDEGLIDDFDTLEEAQECARECIEEERREAQKYGEWGDNADRIEIRYRYTVERSFEIKKTDEYSGEYSDYEMRSVIDHKPLDLKPTT